MTTTLKDALQAPTAPALAGKPGAGPSAKIEVKRNDVAVELKAEVGGATDDAARAVLLKYNLNPDEWVATGFRAGDWTMPNGEAGESARFTFARKGSPSDLATLDLDEILQGLEVAPDVPIVRPDGDHGFIVGLGDMQFFKIDGDGVEGTLKRTIKAIDQAAARFRAAQTWFNFGHLHCAWLGDHVEGFVSQGGANSWRTQGTLNDQIRLTRRVMQHALTRFAPLAKRVTFAAVPGNHGETVRFAGKGVTRYDDSHDTEALIAVSEAARLAGPKFDHVEFYVPDNDELTITLDVAGTRVGHAHGHMHRPNKHFEWWEKQAFGGSPLRDADLLLEGHLHHFHSEQHGRRLYLGVGALESESTWFRHTTGTPGGASAVTAITKDGLTSEIGVLHL